MITCDNIERQVAELEALESMWPEELDLDSHERNNYELAAQASASHELKECCVCSSLPSLSGRVSFGGRKVALRFNLPSGYPAECLPRLGVEYSGQRRTHDLLSAALEEHIASLGGPGEECLLTAADALRTAAAALTEEAPAPEEPTAGGSTAEQTGGSSEESIGRRVIWFHHIKSVTKRKHIVGFANELGLGGFSKPGFPGIIVVEGAEDGVQEYVRRLKQLRWQAMAVRAEDVEQVKADASAGDPLKSRRRLPLPFRELPESGMTELAEHCRDSGMEQMFLTALKISR